VTPGRNRSAVVLAYHAIADLPLRSSFRPYSVPRAELIDQLDALERAGYEFIDLDALLAALDGSPALPKRAALVTFDDCYDDLRAVVAPLLAHRGIPALAFAVAGKLGATNDWDVDRDEPGLRLLDVEGLHELGRFGIEVGAHSLTHARLTELPPAQLAAEVAGCYEQLEAAGLPRPRAFAYPYGAHDTVVVAAVRQAGFHAAFVTQSGVVTGRSDRYRLPRMELRRGDTGMRFRLRLVAARARALPSPARTKAISARRAQGGHPDDHCASRADRPGG
jgi:peptidoglycan/xylan/chitin deacetylase (PgdA/CDA1 family)